jgi:hypothetical protein
MSGPDQLLLIEKEDLTHSNDMLVSPANLILQRFGADASQEGALPGHQPESATSFNPILESISLQT